MSRQISLYNPSFRPQKKAFTAKAILQALGVMVLLVAAAYYSAARQVGQLQAHVAAAERQLQARLERLKAAPGGAKAGDEKQLDARIAELQAALQANENLLAQTAATPGSEYAETLRALARQRLEGVWLTSISLDGPGAELSLAGRALEASLVPQYIDRLRQDPAMLGRRFATLSIEHSASAATAGMAGAGAAESIAFRLAAEPESK